MRYLSESSHTCIVKNYEKIAIFSVGANLCNHGRSETYERFFSKSENKGKVLEK